MPLPILTGITIYLPDGQVKEFTPEQVVAYGAAPTVVVAVKEEGKKYTKYAGFPTVFHEEEAAIVRPAHPGLLGMG